MPARLSPVDGHQPPLHPLVHKSSSIDCDSSHIFRTKQGVILYPAKLVDFSRLLERLLSRSPPSDEERSLSSASFLITPSHNKSVRGTSDYFHRNFLPRKAMFLLAVLLALHSRQSGMKCWGFMASARFNLSAGPPPALSLLPVFPPVSSSHRRTDITLTALAHQRTNVSQIKTPGWNPSPNHHHHTSSFSSLRLNPAAHSINSPMSEIISWPAELSH